MRTGAVGMSDYTRKQLHAVGWQDGDPVPGDLGQRLQEIQAEVLKERKDSTLEDSEMAVGWQAPTASFVDIESLPVEKQQEIAGYLADYKQQLSNQGEYDANMARIDAQIPENVQGKQREIMRQQLAEGEAAQAARAAQRPQQPTGESVVVDDRQVQETTAGPPPDVEIPEGKTYAGAMGQPSVAQKIEEAGRRQREAEAQAAAPTPEVTPELPPAGVGDGPTHCPRCTWPVGMAFDIEPTLEDKQSFMASILGLGRFERKQEVMGGKLVLYFRSLTSDESALVNRQLASMVRSGEIQGDGEYWTFLMEFRMVLALTRIEVGGNAQYAVEPIDEWEKKNPVDQTTPETAPEHADPTAIRRMQAYFYKEGPNQEPLRKIIGEQHRVFQRLVEALETMTSSPDFWQGIELPA